MALPFFGGGYSYEDVVPLPPCSAFTNDDPCEPLYGIFNHTCLAPLNWSLSAINGSLYLVEDNSCGDTPIGLGVVFLLLIAFFAFSGGGGGAKARDIKTPPPDKAYINKADAPRRRRHRSSATADPPAAASSCRPCPRRRRRRRRRPSPLSRSPSPPPLGPSPPALTRAPVGQPTHPEPYSADHCVLDPDHLPPPPQAKKNAAGSLV